MPPDQLEEFLKRMQADPALKEQVLACATADDVAKIAREMGYEFSGDELVMMSGKKVGKVTVKKNDLPGEYF